ncbi:MAG: hypothetical protein K9I47_00825 [Bacteroidales bacterium]|nr:hypothetical protein [Bacteroidales bacterium]
MQKILLIAITGLFLAGCAKDITVNYRDQGKGKVELKPSKNVYDGFVLVNDSMLVDSKTIKSVTIENIPEGNYDVIFRSNYSYYKGNFREKYDIEIGPEEFHQKNIVVPGYNTSYYLMFSVALIPWWFL